MSRHQDDTLDLNDYKGGDSKPALKAEHLNGKKKAILTIAVVRTGIKLQDGQGGSRNAAVIEFEELPDYTYWINKQGLTALVERYGNKTGGWVGKPCPMTVDEATNPKTGEVVDSLQVMRPMDWDDALSIASGKPARKSGAKKTTTRKRASK